jgi:hypothetical protein
MKGAVVVLFNKNERQPALVQMRQQWNMTYIQILVNDWASKGGFIGFLLVK